MLVVDAHEDIAYNALRYNRDYATSALGIRAAEINSEAVTENGLACLGRDEWLSGHVGIIFATLFSPPYSHYSGNSEQMYYRNSAQAHNLANNQLNYYLNLEQKGDLQIIRNRTDLDKVVASWDELSTGNPIVGLVLLMEEPIQ